MLNLSAGKVTPAEPLVNGNRIGVNVVPAQARELANPQARIVGGENHSLVWGAPKSEASNATIGVNRCVIERIHRLKLLTVQVKAGRAVRRYKVVNRMAPRTSYFSRCRRACRFAITTS